MPQVPLPRAFAVIYYYVSIYCRLTALPAEVAPPGISPGSPALVAEFNKVVAYCSENST